MKLNDLNAQLASDKFLRLLITNTGDYIYYIEFTNELLLSTEKMSNGVLVLSFGKNDELDLGPITYVGKL